MKSSLRFNKIILGIGVLVCAGSWAWAQEYSHVRIVRLSFEEGTVTLTRPNVAGSQEASVNTPIEEGFALTTAQDSFAEVEFENTSTARIGQLSELDFNQLALDSNGNKLNRMELRQGYATFTFLPENSDVYEVQAGMATITPATEKGLRFRVDMDGANVRVEVFQGNVEVAGTFGQEQVSKNNVLEFQPDSDQPIQITHGITKDAWDEWVDEREDAAQLARRKGPPGNYTNEVGSSMYGWNDLYYYGNWDYIPGYGNCWIPAVGYGWVPFSYGQWMWYPGFGYTWISYEPWGWIPFHYGGWINEPGFGWAWVPGGFNAWSPALVNWYQGQSWVAWSPRPLRPRPGGGPGPAQNTCPGTSCATVVSTEAFRTGGPIQGHRLPGVIVTQNFAVQTPSIAPAVAVQAVGNQTTAAGTPATRMPGAMPRPGAAPSAGVPRTAFEGAGNATEGRVVFDSKQGTFVNGRESAPAKPASVESPAPSVVRPEAAEPAPVPTAAPVARPAPAHAGAAAPAVRPASEDSHHASPRTGVESPRSQGSFERMLQSWGVGNSGGGGSSHSSSGSWPSSSSGGARSGGSSGISMGSSGGGGGHASSGGHSGGGPHR